MSEQTSNHEDDPIIIEDQDYADAPEHTDWGPARRLSPPLAIDGLAPHWSIPSGHLRRHPARWPA